MDWKIALFALFLHFDVNKSTSMNIRLSYNLVRGLSNYLNPIDDTKAAGNISDKFCGRIYRNFLIFPLILLIVISKVLCSDKIGVKVVIGFGKLNLTIATTFINPLNYY